MPLLVLAAALGWACGSGERPPAPGAGSTTNGGGSSAGSAMTSDSGAQGGSAGAAGSAGLAGAGAGGAGGNDAPPTCVPRPACRSLCQTMGRDPSGCGFGNTQQCGCLCEQRLAGPCPDELEALHACAGESPTLDCALRGRVFEGCEDESVALELCDFNAREQLCARAYPECTPFCTSLTLSFCAQGPESISSCLCGCEATLASDCEAEFAAFMSCSGSAPAFVCDAEAAPVPTACDSEWQALDRCSRGLGPLAPDAG